MGTDDGPEADRVAAKPEAPATLGPEVERILTTCIFAIATGRWPPGDPVPSVRAGAERWEAAPATVHAAYQTLVERDVLRSESRRGYFVRESPSVAHLVRHRETLRSLYSRVRELLADHPELSPVGAFRDMLQQAEHDAAASPECAFVECTHAQARRHAGEVEARLRLPCAALDLDDLLTDDGWGPPAGMRTVLTTAFHLAEVQPAAERNGLRCVSVPLACSPAETRAIARGAARIEILSVNPEQGRLVADDMRAILGTRTPGIRVRASSPAEVEAALAELLGAPDHPAPDVAVVVSMYLWQALPTVWAASGRVHPYPYRIAPEAWTDLAPSLGLPLAV